MNVFFQRRNDGGPLRRETGPVSPVFKGTPAVTMDD
jgi:hypothetical protein